MRRVSDISILTLVLEEQGPGDMEEGSLLGGAKCRHWVEAAGGK